MKQFFSIALILLSISMFSQSPLPSERGAGSLMLDDEEDSGTTRAVIIGISNYLEITPKLQFAHRDAEIFNEFLRSNAGGALPAENIRLLTNEKATLAAIDDALNWLVSETKKDDKVIIYFSGHGDVEKQFLWQRGYLLAYDTPKNNYRNNAEKVEDLDELVKTLSVGRESKVIIILDACRSGTLANTGPSLTNEQLAKQVENEVRILSCKSDQKSLEGEQWGQGRGLFSYYLVNGLKGLADEQNDWVVTFEELRDYLQKNVKKAIAEASLDARQNPVFVGDESFKLAKVDESTLVALNQELNGGANAAIAMADEAVGQPMAMTSTASPTTAVIGKGVDDGDSAEKSMDEELAANLQYLDLGSLAILPEFKQVLENKGDLLAFFTNNFEKAIEEGTLSLSQKTGAEAFIALAKKAENDDKMSRELRNKLAIELHNRAQLAINKYLRGDADELANRQIIELANAYVQYPNMLEAAMQLVGNKHPLYARTQVKYLYFNGVFKRLQREMGTTSLDPDDDPMAIQLKALALDDKAPYIHNEMGLLYLRSNNTQKAKQHFEIAADLAPDWAIPRSNLSIIYRQNKQLDKAAELAEEAVAIQPSYAGAHINLGNIWTDRHNFLKAETQYLQALALNEEYYFPYERLGYILLETTRYAEAEWMFSEAEILKSGFILYPETADFDLDGIPDARGNVANSITFPALPGKLKTAEDYFKAGMSYFNAKMYSDALPYFKKVVELAPNHQEVYDYLGQTLYHLNRYEEAELSFQKLLKLRPNEPLLRFHLADVYQAQGRWQEEEGIYTNLIQSYPAPSDTARQAYLRLFPLLDKQLRYHDEDKKILEYTLLYPMDGNGELARFYSRMTELFPNNPDWFFKYGSLLTENGMAYQGIYVFNQVLSIDSTYSARAYLHLKLGEYFLNESLQSEKSEVQIYLAKGTGAKKFNGKNEDLAINHFKEAARLMPELSSSRYGLARTYLEVKKYEEAITVLEYLLRNGQIDLTNRLVLGDLYSCTGKFAAADSLLTKVDSISFDVVPWLNELRGKLALLAGKNKEAIAFYEKELSQNPARNRGEIYYTIARLKARAGNKDEAWKWLQKAISNEFKYKLVMQYDQTWKEYKQRWNSDTVPNPTGGG